ncbi:hypothetical protein ACOSQ3_001654 [Xanthoceras sorbifolium]
MLKDFNRLSPQSPEFTRSPTRHPTQPIYDFSLARAAQHTHPRSLTVSLSPIHLSILWPPPTVASHRRLLSSSRRTAFSASRRRFVVDLVVLAWLQPTFAPLRRRRSVVCKTKSRHFL